MKWISYAVYSMLLSTLLFTACTDDDVPPAENPEETITNVTLTFTPDGGGSAVVATWLDADGEGANNPELTDIELSANTSYTMNIELTNALDPSDPEDITEEVEEEGDEHLFFFGWTNGLFSDPSGDGNIDNRSDPVNYAGSPDENGYPVGLQTEWTTAEENSGTFRVVLKHQPDIKSASSSVSDGESDVDITWNIVIQ